MGFFHWYVLRGYFAFITLATLLSLIQRRSETKPQKGSVQEKSVVYILINLAFLTAIWLPQGLHLLAILLAMISALASWELLRALRVNSQMCWIIPMISAALVLAADWSSFRDFVKIWWGILLVGLALISLGMFQENLGQNVIALMGSLVYLPLCMLGYLWVWHLDTSGFHAVFLFLTIAANDIYAQISGQLFGKHSLAPRISPSKTVEGAIGGVVFASIVGLGLSPTLHWSYAYGAVIGAMMGLTGLIGDLSESRWKRALGIKDFSELLGANGGVLDRFDSLLFAAPIFYLLLSL